MYSVCVCRTEGTQGKDRIMLALYKILTTAIVNYHCIAISLSCRLVVWTERGNPGESPCKQPCPLFEGVPLGLPPDGTLPPIVCFLIANLVSSSFIALQTLGRGC